MSYIAVGPVFGTATKDTGYDAVGVELVGRAAAASIDVVGIGGVTLDRVPQVMAAGATSVAVSRICLPGATGLHELARFLAAAAAARAAL